MSRKFEKESYACMKTVESDEMLFILLNLPLPQHGGKSLGELAVEENRMYFLNNDRMSARSMYTNSLDVKIWNCHLYPPLNRHLQFKLPFVRKAIFETGRIYRQETYGIYGDVDENMELSIRFLFHANGLPLDWMQSFSILLGLCCRLCMVSASGWADSHLASRCSSLWDYSMADERWIYSIWDQRSQRKTLSLLTSVTFRYMMWIIVSLYHLPWAKGFLLKSAKVYLCPEGTVLAACFTEEKFRSRAKTVNISHVCTFIVYW